MLFQRATYCTLLPYCPYKNLLKPRTFLYYYITQHLDTSVPRTFPPSCSNRTPTFNFCILLPSCTEVPTLSEKGCMRTFPNSTNSPNPRCAENFQKYMKTHRLEFQQFKAAWLSRGSLIVSKTAEDLQVSFEVLSPTPLLSLKAVVSIECCLSD